MDFEVPAEKPSTVAMPTTKMRIASNGSIQILFFTLMRLSSTSSKAGPPGAWAGRASSSVGAEDDLHGRIDRGLLDVADRVRVGRDELLHVGRGGEFLGRRRLAGEHQARPGGLDLRRVLAGDLGVEQVVRRRRVGQVGGG